MLPKGSGRPAQWGPGQPALCKQEKQALESFLFRRIYEEDKRSHYPQGCGPGVTLSGCFLPLSAGTQRLGPCSLL